MSHIRFDAEDRVALHQDFWDSAAGLFEHVPVVGGLIRTIKRRCDVVSERLERKTRA